MSQYVSHEDLFPFAALIKGPTWTIFQDIYPDIPYTRQDCPQVLATPSSIVKEHPGRIL